LTRIVSPASAWSIAGWMAVKSPDPSASTMMASPLWSAPAGAEHREARACQHERQQAHEPRASSGRLRERTVASQLVERT
jgi:hypothetical protein